MISVIELSAVPYNKTICPESQARHGWSLLIVKAVQIIKNYLFGTFGIQNMYERLVCVLVWPCGSCLSQLHLINLLINLLIAFTVTTLYSIHSYMEVLAVS